MSVASQGHCIMNEPSTAVLKAPSGTTTPCPIIQEPKYDNFYSPQNNEFYSKFCYMSLKSEQHTIRLLRIQPLAPGEDERSQIKCELIDNQSLAAMRGEFTTISYCAGDPKKTETIIVNGLEFNAFSNLGHALRQARHFWKQKYESRELLLWADQVCINQSNPNERAHQVKFMGDIYGSAEQVLVCLSVEGDRSGGIEWLQQFPSKFLEHGQSTSYNKGASDSNEPPDRGYKFLLDNFDEESFHRGWDAFLATILKSPWWPRAWIRQEYLCSPDAYLLAANESIHWEPAAEAIDTFYHAAYVFDLWVEKDRISCTISSRRPSENCQACLQSMQYFEFLKARMRASRLLSLKRTTESRDLLDNLGEMHLCEASDPRDLVYACFGVSSHTYGLSPDYSSNLSFQDVLIQVAHNVIAHTKSLGILRNAYLTKQISPDSDIPSWVPDWRNHSILWPGHCYAVPSRSTDFFAFYPDKQGRPGRILQVRGILVKVLGSKKDQWPEVLSYLLEDVRPVGYALDNDEVYLLHGFGKLIVLRRQNDEYFKVVEEVLGFRGVLPGVDLLVDDLERMVERNDAAVKIINIC